MGIDGVKIEGTPIEDQHRIRITHALSRMYYAGEAAAELARIQSIGRDGASGCTVEALADWIESMVGILKDVAAEATRREDELLQLTRDIRAAARIVDIVLGSSKTVGRLVTLAEFLRDEAEGRAGSD